MIEKKKFETTWEGIPLKVEAGQMAQQTNGSCLVQYGETVILATAVMDSAPRADVGFFPLSVDYEEKMYAAGKIKGSRFIKRETRPTDEAVLTARLIDRSIRPLFNKNFKLPVQVALTILSIDMENSPDVPALLAASIALSISDIPWKGGIAGVRVTNDEEGWHINSNYERKNNGKLDLFVAGNGEKAIMIEMGAKEATEDEVFEGVVKAKQSLAKVVSFIDKIVKEIGKEKLELTKELNDKEKELNDEVTKITKMVEDLISSKINDYLLGTNKPTKALRKKTLKKMKQDIKEYLLIQDIKEDVLNKALSGFTEFIELKISETIIKNGKRVDGRAIDEVRPLAASIDLLPRTHGSALFQRGETQVLSVVTLGAPRDEQTIDTMEFDGVKRYMHHYNFPGFSVGEVKFFRGASRRDIGHGSLAEKALLPVLPEKAEFPYAIRVVSEVLGSNGSSSMGAVCGSSLSLMDAGVPIKKHVAGIAIGLASDKKGNFRVFTDLQDLEDSEGGMDFKVAGTKDGITAIQLDTKTDGLSDEIVKQALKMAKDARITIIGVMEAEVGVPKEAVSEYAPKIEILHIKPEKIGDVIGPGGKVIKGIIEQTGAEIDIEQDGSVFFTAKDQESLDAAVNTVKGIVKEILVGEEYESKVVRLLDFGAFVELLPRQEALLHVSEIDHKRIDKPADVLKAGQMVKVKVIEIDNLGRVNVSAKALLPRPDNLPPAAPRSANSKPKFGGQKRDFGNKKKY